VDHWLQERPQPLAGAALAWSAPIEAAAGMRAVVYGMKAVNPRPNVEILTIDVWPGQDDEGRPADRAVPALLAITAGTIVRGK
jgi:hypothetical protein